VQRLRRRYAAELPLLADGPPALQSIAAAYEALRSSGHDVGCALRVLRQLVLERLVTLDCDRHASLGTITSAMSELAEFALDVACQQAFRDLDAAHGAPLTPEGQRAQLWVVGMGKLGARELNVSSDIDLVYVYDQDGETAGTTPEGRGRITNHEYFGKAVKNVFGLIGDVTEHGFVFRVDLALRPNGNSGPPAVSLGALEDYLLVQGREWERFAWMKSRVVAPRDCIDSGSAQGLRPWCFRSCSAATSTTPCSTHCARCTGQIREHAARRAAGRPERANDVKLSRGGIREIEFIVQLLQVVRGGQFPELRTRPTLQALERLSVAGLMSEQTARSLAAAYTFLRQVEHRIQYLDDQQTHVLPMGCRDDDDGSDLNWIAHTMGYADCCPSCTNWTATANSSPRNSTSCWVAAQRVPRCTGPRAARRRRTWTPSWSSCRRSCSSASSTGARTRGCWRCATTRAPACALVARTASGCRKAASARKRPCAWPTGSSRCCAARATSRCCGSAPRARAPAAAAGAARWPARYLIQHPGVIDELASDGLLKERFKPMTTSASWSTGRARCRSRARTTTRPC
jgi:glutamate-ammonia-ligase adenylyltransferase